MHLCTHAHKGRVWYHPPTHPPTYAGLEVSELDHIVLQVRAGHVAHASECDDARHEDEEVESGATLQRAPQLEAVLLECPSGDARAVELFQKVDGDAEHQQNAKDEAVIFPHCNMEYISK